MVLFATASWYYCLIRESSHAPSRAALCPQTSPLVPQANAGVWSDVSKAFETDTFIDRAADLLGGAVRVPTEVYDEMGSISEDARWEVFASFHEYLVQAFPQIHTTLQLTKVNTHGLVYTWKGSDEALKPLFLTAHQDVVPVNPDTYDQWVYPPFSGHYDGTYVWGRGSEDDKSGLVSLMTAVEVLLEHGFQPKRSVILAFGFDEETSGMQGALAISEFLLSKYGENAFAMLVDEGGGCMIEKQYGALFALPAIAEKGYMDIRIDVAAPGGHSSVPPAHTAIGMLAEILVQYEMHPFEVKLKRDSPMYHHAQCLATYASELPGLLRDAVLESASSDKALRRAQDLLFEDGVFKALVGTTQAVDIIGGGVKSNALPENAMALINHRIATESSAASVREHATCIVKPVAEKLKLSLTAFGVSLTGAQDSPAHGVVTLSDAWDPALEPAPITPTGPDAAPFQLLAGTIKTAHQSRHSNTQLASSEDSEIHVIPSLGSGNTDTHYYWKLTPHIFRYSHYYPGAGPRASGMHTVNEACLVTGLVEMITFFTALILNADEASL
ncbi:hypothetical protein IEO21_03669 [Rhodonia placenta]|uniref:Peptidase M20 dimerisation domain-containing protein n=1 Tax=Rhodonia placenta TaxID=104341 RepID=A0A8H7P5G6_9APHY|nr:hypothetical protein IEO21_03669 [Postia placenta]